MRVLKTLVLTALVLCFAAAGSQAGVYYFSPTPSADLWDLDHYRYYTWGIDWTQHTDEVITGATFTFTNIWDWTVESDYLYSVLLDNPALGAIAYWDYQGGGNNFANNVNFSSQQTHIGTWSDAFGGRSRGFDLTYDLGALGLLDEMNTYAADGRFGFGFDPDCHYYNRGLTLTITTAPRTSPVPEPATMALFGLGAAGLGLLRRKK